MIAYPRVAILLDNHHQSRVDVRESEKCRIEKTIEIF